jgi:hypothetical protein
LETPLAHLIYGKPPAAQAFDSAWDILYATPEFNAHDGKTFYDEMPLSPFSEEAPAFGVMRVSPEYFLVGQAFYNKSYFVRVPSKQVQALNGDLEPLVELMREPFANTNKRLRPAVNWTLDARLKALSGVMELVNNDLMNLLMLLGGAIYTAGMSIHNFDGDLRTRLQLMQGLTLLLPAPIRYYFTFSTHSTNLPPNRPRVIFASKDTPSQRQHLTWGQWNLHNDTQAVGMSYIGHLAGLWRGDLEQFTRYLMHIDQIVALSPLEDAGLAQSLQEVAKRHMLDIAIQDPTSGISSQEIITVLESASHPAGELRELYLNRLLELALETRETDTIRKVLLAMDSQVSVDLRLNKTLESALETQPDAVYAFVRVRLSEGMDERWLQRLHKSARMALDVAIQSADPITIANWLLLLAREPQRYELGDILHEGVLKAVPLSYDSPRLAKDLLVIAVKREPATLLHLLDDVTFKQALTSDIRSAVLDHNTDAIFALSNQSRELFLLSIVRASETPQTISHDIVSRLWELYTSTTAFVVAEAYRPINIIKHWGGEARDSLQDGVLNYLLASVLGMEDDELFIDLAIVLAQDEALATVLYPSLQSSLRPTDSTLTLLNSLLIDNILSAQNTANIYVALADQVEWQEKSTPIVEQLGRLLSQYPEVKLKQNTLWSVLDFATQNKNEILTKSVFKRLLESVTQSDSEEQLVKNLLRLRKASASFSYAKLSLQVWWRNYLETLSSAQLSKLERALEGQRPLDDLRASISTFIAIRKQLLNKTIIEWAQEANTAFRFLKSLSDAFDPENRSNPNIDIAMLQHHIQIENDTLDAATKQIFIANLKDLTDLIAVMAEARSKPSILGNDDTLDRQLAAGEHPLHGAVDVMKWLAGYLDKLDEP